MKKNQEIKKSCLLKFDNLNSYSWREDRNLFKSQQQYPGVVARKRRAPSAVELIARNRKLYIHWYELIYKHAYYASRGTRRIVPAVTVSNGLRDSLGGRVDGCRCILTCLRKNMLLFFVLQFQLNVNLKKILKNLNFWAWNYNSFGSYEEL